MGYEVVESVSFCQEQSPSRINICGSQQNDTVLQKMKDRLSQLPESRESESFCVIDLGCVFNEYQRWTNLLPNIKPFYGLSSQMTSYSFFSGIFRLTVYCLAVKCNPDVHIIKLLAALNSGFDCASRNEIEAVLAQGASPEKIIFANPCKKISDLKYAQQVGVKKMTFDNVAELHKIKQLIPDVQLILRVLASDSSATYLLGAKYGASLATSTKLLQSAKSLGLSIVGVSFHIGSDAKDPTSFDRAIRVSREVFNCGLDAGHDMRLLDIGGGFSGHNFDLMATSVRQSIKRYFHDINVEVVAEPGRYLVWSCLSVACGIIGRRDAAENEQDNENRHMIYLNDGVYGIFLSNIFEIGPQPKPLRVSGVFYPPDAESEYAKYTIWGPTCDEIDCVIKSAALPSSLTVDDWIYFPDMGAYTTCLTTRFNGFRTDREMIYVCSEPAASEYIQSAYSCEITSEATSN